MLHTMLPPPCLFSPSSPPPCRPGPRPRTPPQASSNQPGNLDKVKALVESPAFQITNPNNCYSLFLAFARSPVNFHASECPRGWLAGKPRV